MKLDADILVTARDLVTPDYAADELERRIGKAIQGERERCAKAVEAEIAPENDPEANDCLRMALQQIRPDVDE